MVTSTVTFWQSEILRAMHMLIVLYPIFIFHNKNIWLFTLIIQIIEISNLIIIYIIKNVSKHISWESNYYTFGNVGQSTVEISSTGETGVLWTFFLSGRMIFRIIYMRWYFSRSCILTSNMLWDIIQNTFLIDFMLILKYTRLKNCRKSRKIKSNKKYLTKSKIKPNDVHSWIFVRYTRSFLCIALFWDYFLDTMNSSLWKNSN